MGYTFLPPIDCTGCELCVNVCPVDIIYMKKNIEGFYYPQVIDNSKCIYCKKCEKFCPVLNKNEFKSNFKKSVVGWSNIASDVLSSSSGGIATLISKYMIDMGGIVYGVRYSEDFGSVFYSRTDSYNGLEKFKTSKYVQSIKNDVYKQIRNDISLNKKILFIGLPCDVAAVKLRFNKYKNLYLISLICHGVTSIKIHELYLTDKKKRVSGELNNFSLRYKKDGNYKPYYILIESKNGNRYTEKYSDSIYNTAFQYLKRPSCYSCHFKGSHYPSDLLIGDFHSAERVLEHNNPHGVSSIIVLTELGDKILNDINKSSTLFEMPLKCVTHQYAVNNSIKKKKNREKFSRKLATVGLESACSLPSVKLIDLFENIRKRIRIILSKIINMLGVFDI